MKPNSHSYVELDAWAAELVVDPLSKEPLTVTGDYLRSPYGRRYPIHNGIFHLRLLPNCTTHDQRVWRAGQDHYEAWAASLAAHDAKADYAAEIDGVRAVYGDLPLIGDVLDVGGNHGRLRHFIAKGQRYFCCDPSIRGFDLLDLQPNLVAAYPFLRDSMNFVCCDAEHLPLRSTSFDTVHMRSVLDHFLNPELALAEAFRVLRPSGTLIVGLHVEEPGFRTFVRDALGRVMQRYRDYHVFHPTFAQLRALVSSAGFSIERVHWQAGHRSVCYVRAVKPSASALNV